MSATLPSRKVSYRTFFDEENYLLEVKFRDSFVLYALDKGGQEELLSTSAAPYQGGEEIENELDALPAEVLRKIDLLTTRYDYSEAASDLNRVLENFKKESYSFRDFTMADAYIFENHQEIIDQLFAFTQEEEYLAQAKDLRIFFENNFYERDREFSVDEKQAVEARLRREISFLNSLRD